MSSCTPLNQFYDGTSCLAEWRTNVQKLKMPHPVRNPEAAIGLLLINCVGDCGGSRLIDCIPLLAPFCRAFWLHSITFYENTNLWGTFCGTPMKICSDQVNLIFFSVTAVLASKSIFIWNIMMAWVVHASSDKYFIFLFFYPKLFSNNDQSAFMEMKVYKINVQQDKFQVTKTTCPVVHLAPDMNTCRELSVS